MLRDLLSPQRSGQDEKNLASILPADVPILPLRNLVALPMAVIPLAVGIPRSIRLIEDAMISTRLIGLATMKDPEIEEPAPDEVHETGTIALIHKVVHTDEGGLQVIVQGLEKFRVEAWTATDPYLKARVKLVAEEAEESLEATALRQNLLQLAIEVADLLPNVPEGAAAFLEQVKDNRQLVYLIAANVQMELAQEQAILEADSINEKMLRLCTVLSHEKEVLSLRRKIAEEASEEMNKTQREYFLRQQIEAIRKELGESDEQEMETAEYRRKIEEAKMPEEAEKEALRELKRLESMPPQAAEHSVIKTYLDWLVELPWNSFSEDNLEIPHARQVLDEDHYDLQKVKDRILEFLAVRKLVQERGITPEEGYQSDAQEAMGAILCFVGPPGVGKTSLGKSIARALGRQFTRMSLGGMRDEAEIRGHRRTYIGAMPGRIIQAIKRAGTRNPVFMLDEVDKIGSDWRGDPSSALLEVLDPQQNNAFRDHYLDVDFDLSDVIFITTANTLETIPDPLRDRMEIIALEGYTEYEKLRIAEGFLVPRQRRANGLREEEIAFGEDALRAIIRDYTREAGVRNLEREIGQVCRKVAVKIAANEVMTLAITSKEVRELLGKPKFFFDAGLRTERPGVATGLAWTPVGGDVLFIEATRMRGKGNFTITGQLGDVMSESVRIAYSWVQANAETLDIDPDLFENSNFHLHVPAGATPKDGPSAGVTMTTALASLLTGRPVRADVGMTGEITLRGQVLPIGGLKQKVLAAHRAGLKTVILPQRNEADLEDLPTDVTEAMQFVPVEHIEQVLEAALQPVELPIVVELPGVETVLN
ncbi:MAG: endopeptidase La [Caldilineales bacterium]|nr:endopeptidase La [Caldilineales bacterium]MCW5860245.1 endopeptidase La [Caldilineales bacterium]